MIKTISINSRKILKFLYNIDDDFSNNKSLLNSPWKYSKLKNFLFLYYFKNSEIIGTIVISNHKKNVHINFLYVLKKFRSKNIGSKLIKYVEKIKKKELISVHIFKNSKKTEKFYMKNGFIKYKKYNDLEEFILKAKKFDHKVYKEKKLFYKTA